MRHSVGPKTYANYELCVRRLLPHLGRARLRALAPEHIQHALGKLLDRGLAARTVRQVHMVLHCSLKQAVLWRLMASNPSDAVKPPRADRKEMQTLSEDEVQRLLTATAGTRHHSLWVFLVTTGVRLGEALALRWADIDFVEGRATMRRSLRSFQAERPGAQQGMAAIIAKMPSGPPSSWLACAGVSIPAAT